MSPVGRWPWLGRVYDWLACADSPYDADLIFALAGQQGRKVYGLRLFREKRAPRVLLSTGRFEIRRFADLDLPYFVNLLETVAKVAPQQRHFFVSLERQNAQVERIPVRRLGTLGEIEALANWLHDRPQIASVLIISSGLHLRRVKMCCRTLLPRKLKLRLIAVPDESPWLNRDGWWRERHARTLVLSELGKLLLYRLVLTLR